MHASDCAIHNAPALEPAACDCGGGVLELRPDLTDKERAYVMSELARLGMVR